MPLVKLLRHLDDLEQRPDEPLSQQNADDHGRHTDRDQHQDREPLVPYDRFEDHIFRNDDQRHHVPVLAPSAPGSSRKSASITAIAAGSPPDSTNGPSDSDSVATCSRMRASKPS